MTTETLSDAIPVTVVAKAVQKKKSAVKAVKEAVAPLEPTGLVIYADAGVRPTNPGPGGWGIHGYVYNDAVPKKGSGSGYALTLAGYKPRAAKEVIGTEELDDTKTPVGPVQVTPLHYVDGYGTIPHATNNAAEIIAATNGLEYALRYPNTHCKIITDSKYVVTGGSEYLTKWKANNWIKSDGNEVSNKLHWQALDASVSALLGVGSTVSFEWIKGHNGNLGNEMADKYATIGVYQTIGKQTRQEVATSVAEGYWKNETERHALLHHPRSYFATTERGLVPGEYYCGTHGTDDELLGTRMSDGAYSYVLLNEPDELLESVRIGQASKTNVLGAIFMMRLDQLYSPKTQVEIRRFGDAAFYRKNSKTLDMYLVTRMGDKTDEEPLTKELWPPRLASRAIDSINYLKSIYLEYTAGDTSRLVVTDITPHIYEEGKKDTTKLKNEFGSGVASFEVKCNYAAEDKVTTAASLTLFLGIDLPDRNTLKKLEKMNTKIQLLSWKESPLAFRYVTIVTCDSGKGIWAGCYTNFKFLKE